MKFVPRQCHWSDWTHLTISLKIEKGFTESRYSVIIRNMAKYICIIYCHYICFLFHYLPYKRQRLSDRHRFDIDPTLACRVDVQSISFQWSLICWMDGPLPSSCVLFCHSNTTIENIKTGCYHSKSCGTSVVVNSFISRAKNTTWWPSQLTHRDRDKMDAISQTTFSSAFSLMKMFEFRLKCYWNMFLRVQLTIFQHWFR